MSSSSSRSSSPDFSVQQKRKREAESAETVDDHGAASDAEPPPDDPVLSHADRRKQRKAEKRKAKEAEQGATTINRNTKKKRKLENGRSVSVSVSSAHKNSVWVGNLSFKTTQENLKAFFKDVGEVMRIRMPTKPGANKAMKPENRGFAYVDFATKDAKIVAITLSERPLLGRKLLIKDGDDFTGRPVKEGADVAATGANTHSKTARKILQAQKQPPAPTLFLGNLGFDATEDDIKQLLEAHRPKPSKKKVAPGEEEIEEKNNTKDVWLRKVRMGTFEDSGLCKGFAFVDFTSTEHATTALINPRNHRLNGRDLVVEYAGPDAVRRGTPKGSKREDGSAPSLSKKRDVPPHSQRAERPERTPRHNQDETKIGGQVEQETEQGDDVHINPEDHRKARKTFSGKERKEKGPRSRPKPGAALAQAKRESAAILPSQGRKITF